MDASGLFDRYLAILGVAERPPSLHALGVLVRAHLMRVPFENVSKLFFRKREGANFIPGFEDYLDGIERFNMGGTCYSNNIYLYLLLRYLGYDIKLCGADMSGPDVHIVSMVRLEGREYMVDVGYAAPFFEPMARDLDAELVIESGRYRWVLKPQDEARRSRMVQYRDGKRNHGYIAKPQPRAPEFFSEVIRDSYRPGSTFMNAVVLVRYFEDRFVRIHNLSVTESEGNDVTVTELADRRELVGAIRELFGIPAAVVRVAFEGLGVLIDVRGVV